MKVYAIGDYVIKANDGVCKVEDILHLDIPDTDKNKLYYLLIPVADKGGKLYLSTEKADQNLRKVLSEREAWEVIKKIPDIEAMWIEMINCVNRNTKRQSRAVIQSLWSAS